MNYISINEIFAKVKADLGLNDTTVNISDWVTWTGEALKKVGAYKQFVHRITGVRDHYQYFDVLEVTNYETEVPCDLYKINAVAFSTSKMGGFYPCRKATGPFDLRQKFLAVDNEQTVGTLTTTSTMTEKITFVRDVFNESWSEAFSRINSDADLNAVLDMVFITDGNMYTNYAVQDYVYQENLPYLRFNMQTGYAIVAYQALPTDEDGYPMIPDDEDLKEAIFWYINMKLKYIDYNRHIEGAKDLYKDAQYEWKSKKMAAYGNMMMLEGVDDLVTFQNVWLRMIPKLHAHATGYKGIGSKEKLYTRF